MKREPLRQISVDTAPEAEDAVMDLLNRLFGQPAAVYHNEETKVSSVSVYCPRSQKWSAREKAALATGIEIIRDSGLNIGTAKISSELVAKEDWSESWKRHFKPIAIGSRLLIKPSWIKRKLRKGQAVVVLDPGLSFGTGNHPTTGYCLHEVVACRKPNEHQAFWDIGTGSGILAIAAAKLGFAPIDAIDFDPEAIRVARQNAAQNRVLDRIQIRRQDITRLPLVSRKKYHLICANLISNLLLAEQKRIINRLHPDGTLVLAGILKTEFAQVAQAYTRAGLKLVNSREEGEWQSGAFVFAP